MVRLKYYGNTDTDMQAYKFVLAVEYCKQL